MALSDTSGLTVDNPAVLTPAVFRQEVEYSLSGALREHPRCPVDCCQLTNNRSSLSSDGQVLLSLSAYG